MKCSGELPCCESARWSRNWSQAVRRSLEVSWPNDIAHSHTCSTWTAACQLYHEDCTYEGKSDGRKPQSKSYVSALEQRVKELEALLGAHTTMDSPADTDVSLGLSQLKVRWQTVDEGLQG